MNVNSASFSISLLILDIYSFMDMFFTIVFSQLRASIFLNKYWKMHKWKLLILSQQKFVDTFNIIGLKM
jgi:hypothetical protein